MKFFYIFIVLILAFKQLCCFLEPDDFCKKDTRKIKICLSYDCGTKFCTFDFISWGILLKKWIKQPKSYETFIIRKSKIVNKMITEINGDIDLALDKKLLL